ncbi:MAG: hypothetical protein LCH46_13260 [Proteobacteria bacterium]|nr:hypothetical protein [Pseudomonadota bacterium]
MRKEGDHVLAEDINIRTPQPIQKQIDELSVTLRLARASFDIWWHYSNKQFVSANKDRLQHFSQFFYFLNEANLFAFVVRICVLFDRRKDTVSLEQALGELGRRPNFNAQALEDAKKLLREVAPSVKKLLTLRNNAMAHKSKFLKFSESYKLAKITPDEMRAVTEQSLSILNILRAGVNMSAWQFDHDFVAEDLAEMDESIGFLGNK